MFHTILKNVALIESNKEDILTEWMNYEVVKKTLQQNNLNINFFQEKFASKVFDFALGVVKSKNDLGNCPVIGVMLMLFKRKSIPLSDIFIICVHFKNSLLLFCEEKNLLNHEMLEEVCTLMDYNFEGVIKEYTKLYYNDRYKHTNIFQNIEEKQTISSEATLQRNSSTSAITYLQEIELDMELVDELNELESDTLNAIDMEETVNQYSLQEASLLFERYSKVLSHMYEFEELAYTLTILSELLSSTKIETIDDETKYMVTIYLKAIISDLQSWRMSIFITNEAEDIHYLDKTLLSSIAQIQITLMPQKEDITQEEVEFF